MEFKMRPETKNDLIEQIKKYHMEEMEQTISDFRAESFLLFVLEAIGPAIYNQAIEDAYALMTAKTEELYGLQKRNR